MFVLNHLNWVLTPWCPLFIQVFYSWFLTTQKSEPKPGSCPQKQLDTWPVLSGSDPWYASPILDHPLFSYTPGLAVTISFKAALLGNVTYPVEEEWGGEGTRSLRKKVKYQQIYILPFSCLVTPITAIIHHKTCLNSFSSLNPCYNYTSCI